MSVTTKLVEWAVELPPWQRDLAARMLEATELSDDALDEVRANLLAAHDGPSSPHSLQTPSSTSFAAMGSVSMTPRIRALENLQNVNAIAPGRRLEFAEDGLSIVYGENAAGKTGYCRVFKRICRAVDRESSVLRDVFEGQPSGPQTAAVETVDEMGKVRTHHLNLADDPPSEFAGISVFDAECADNYVAQANEIAFTPRPLLLFDRMVRAQQSLRSRLEDERRGIEATKPDLDEFDGETEVGSVIHSLSDEIDSKTVEDSAQLTAEDRKRMTELRGLRGADPEEIERRAGTADVEAKATDELTAAIRNLNAVTDDTFAERLNGLRSAAAAKAKAAELARAQAFSGQPMPEVGDRVWQELWEAARRFHEHSSAPNAFPPSEHGSLCPLCLQELSEEARERFLNFQGFIEGTTTAEARAAKSAVETEVGRLDAQLVARCRPRFLETLRLQDTSLADRVEAFVNAAEKRVEALSAKDGSDLPKTLEAPIADLERFANERHKYAQDLRDDETRRAAAAELRELEAVEQLSRRLTPILDWLAKLKQIEILKAAIKALGPGAITRKQTALAKEVITETLRNAFKQELAALGMDDTKIDIAAKGQLGNTVVRLFFPNATGDHSPAEVLSKGEQRGAALAFFLAEVRAGDEDGGIVLDDPVSSLDAPRRRRVADRLAEEAGRREVIIFTHDLVFLVRLMENAEGNPDVHHRVQHIWRSAEGIGLTWPDAPWPGLKVSARLAYLRRRVQEFPKVEELGPENYRREVTGWYEELRETWERAVEEVLFNDVVQRFRPSVETNRLARVPDLTPERRKAVKEGMSRCSSFTHDEATAGEPSKERMEDDLRALDDLVKEIRKPPKEKTSDSTPGEDALAPKASMT